MRWLGQRPRRSVGHCFLRMAPRLLGSLGPMIRKGNPRPVIDLLIAATAKNHGLVLATLNYRHFEGVDGLAVENWSR